MGDAVALGLESPVASANAYGELPGHIVAQNGFELGAEAIAIFRGRTVKARADAQPMEISGIEPRVGNPRRISGQRESIGDPPHAIHANTGRVPI